MVRSARAAGAGHARPACSTGPNDFIPSTVIRKQPSCVEQSYSTADETIMTKLPLILLMSLGMASAAIAQTASGGITMSTDPAKIAAVERHAQELKSRPAPEPQAKPSAKATSSHKAKPHAKKAQPSAKATAKTAAKT